MDDIEMPSIDWLATVRQQNATIVRLTLEVERWKGAHAFCEERITNSAADLTTLRAENEKLRGVLRSLIEACHRGKAVSKGVGGMTIRAQIQNSYFNGIDGAAVVDAEDALEAALTAAPAAPEQEKRNLCDCERSHNGPGIMGRECDCPAGEKTGRDPTNPFAPMEKSGWTGPAPEQEKQDAE